MDGMLGFASWGWILQDSDDDAREDAGDGAREQDGDRELDWTGVEPPESAVGVGSGEIERARMGEGHEADGALENGTALSTLRCGRLVILCRVSRYVCVDFPMV